MLKIAFRNITRRRNNSILMIFSIAIVVGIFTLIWSVFSLSNSGIELSRSRLGADVLVYPSNAKLDEEELMYSGIAEMVFMDESSFSKSQIGDLSDDIEEISTQFFLQTLPAAGCCDVKETFRIVGVDIESDFILRPWLKQEGIQSLENHEIIMGSDMDYKVGDKSFMLNNLFTVSGLLYKTGTGMDNTIFVDIDMAREIAKNSFPDGYFGTDNIDSLVTCYLLKLKDGTDVSFFTEELEKTNENINVAAVSDTQFHLKSQIDLFSKILLGFWVASLILCSIALISQFRNLIYARKKEIGYLRSIGMRRKEIYYMFSLEIGLISIIGGIIGGIFGVVLVNPLVNQLKELLTLPSGEWTIGVAIYHVLGGLGLSLVLSALTSAVPIYNISKMSPYEAVVEGEL